VHPRFPLYGMKLKNSTDSHLQQGPIAVLDGGVYVGDSRLPDLGPGQERLLSYAMDLGVEVRPGDVVESQEVKRVEVVKGQLRQQTQKRKEVPYQMWNRSREERLLLLEQPTIKDWALVGEVKPVEQTQDLYRFEWKVPAGKTMRETIVQERTEGTEEPLVGVSEDRLRECLKYPVTSKAVREALAKVLAFRVGLGKVREEKAAAQASLATALREQERLGANITKLPPTSATYKRHLEKFDQQEKEVERLQQAVAEKAAAEARVQEECKGYLAELTVR
jgi:hypothetical protein